jgi:hypothetical protein
MCCKNNCCKQTCCCGTHCYHATHVGAWYGVNPPPIKCCKCGHVYHQSGFTTVTTTYTWKNQTPTIDSALANLIKQQANHFKGKYHG